LDHEHVGGEIVNCAEIKMAI